MTYQQLLQQPTEFDFYQAVYSLERQFSHEQKSWYGIGRDGFPSQELVRFKAVQHLGFAGQPISKVEAVECDGAQAQKLAVTMHVSFFGLTGPSGVLPQHYSEMVLQRLKQRDKTMRDFFDLFNHRLVSLYYRAWEKYRFACQFETAEAERDSFSAVIRTLSGARQSLGLYYAGAFSQANRSSAQLVQILRDVLHTSVELKPLQGRWLNVAKDEQSALPGRFTPHGQHAVLGQSAMVGSRAWDISSSIELQINVPQADAEQLLPGSYRYALLNQVLADYLPTALNIRLTLLGQHADFPVAQLGSRNFRLGQSGCLQVRPHIQHQATQLSITLSRK